MSVELQYDAWDNTEESFNQRNPAGADRRGKDFPFNEAYVVSLLFEEEHFYHGPKTQDYRESVRQMTALLWHTLAWYRRLGVSSDALKTLIKDYPDTNRGAKFALVDNDTLRDSMDDGKDFVIDVPSLVRNIQ